MMDSIEDALSENSDNLIPLHPKFGMIVKGAKFNDSLSEVARLQIWSMLVKHKLLIFEEIDIDSERLLAFARSFGPLDFYPVGKGKCTDLMHVYSDRETQILTTNHWHSDTSGWKKPSAAILLYAKEIPPVGGDTLFADMGTAYQALPKDIQEAISDLTAEHNELGLGQYVSAAERALIQRLYPPVEHPVVRTHPESGEKILYVNSLLTSHIKNVTPAESERLLNHLCSQATIPEYQVRYRWKKNSIAFFDNRSCQHYASMDYWPASRKLDRISIAGDIPF